MRVQVSGVLVPPVSGVREHLQQVLMNMVQNARQAIAKQGVFRLPSRDRTARLLSQWMIRDANPAGHAGRFVSPSSSPRFPWTHVGSY